MTSQTTPNLMKTFSMSTLTKCLLILTAATLTVAGVLTYKADRDTTEIALEGLQTLARDVTELSSGQLEGAVRFGKVENVVLIIQELLEKTQKKDRFNRCFGQRKWCHGGSWILSRTRSSDTRPDVPTHRQTGDDR
ncbi:MAG: hypothetical protein KJN60_07205, partial [Boseongicola sp.]|nr:hypothetical protein [Boseongicola sp.]